MRVLLSIVFNAVALYATAMVVPGISFRGNVGMLRVTQQQLYNASLTVLNGILLWVASFFLPGYNVAGVVPGIVGSLVFAIVNWALHALFAPKD